MQDNAQELEESEEKLRRAILTLWRTNMLRQTKLKVLDEVANGLSYYDYTFFRELPRIHGAIEDELARMEPKGAPKRIASFLRVGSWIGGDRDGNPFVTPATTREALGMAHELLIQHYGRRLQNVFEQLGSSTQQVPVTPALGYLR